MGLFSKPPAGKPATPDAKAAVRTPTSPGMRGGADVRPLPVSARELAAKSGRKSAEPPREPARTEESITGASLIDWSQSQAFEVAQANPGLCAVLENAALLFASGQAGQARTLLEQGVTSDHDARQSPLAWLALFDVLQRAGDRAAFDQAALQYSVQFERSAPMWEEGGARSPAAAKAATGGGYVAVTGRLAAESAQQIEGLRRAVARKLAKARLDLGGLTGFDDGGATLLAAELAAARRSQMLLSIERAEKLRAALEASVKAGVEGGEGAWLLSLELLQWFHDQATFDERAIEFAVAFEKSPPSWEPPAREPEGEGSGPGSDDAPGETGTGPQDAVVFRGLITGSATPQVAKLVEFAHGRHVVPVDLGAVDRIDFVCAGALLNAVNRVEAQRKSVQIVGASPIIRALLLLIGLSPRHFVKKSA